MSENQAPPYSLRMPVELRKTLEEKAAKNNRSLNSEIVELLEHQVASEKNKDVPFRTINRGEHCQRIIYGKMLNSFDIDFSQDLDRLKLDIEKTLNFLEKTKFSLKLAFMIKNIRVHEGGNHLDIINDGVGSLGWLTVEDNYV